MRFKLGCECILVNSFDLRCENATLEPGKDFNKLNLAVHKVYPTFSWLAVKEVL